MKPKEESASGSLAVGLLAGIVQTAVGQPFDAVKVRVQSEGGTSWQALEKILKQESPFSFYRGWLAPALGQGMAVSLQFSLWEASCLDLGVGKATSGAIAGLLASPVTCVIERIRIAQQLQKPNAFSRLFRGLPLVAARDSIGLAVYYAVFGHLEGRIGVFGAGAAAGVAYWLAVFPVLDGWKTCVQANVELCYWKALQFKLRSPFGGIGACLLRAVPVNAATFLVWRHWRRAE